MKNLILSIIIFFLFISSCGKKSDPKFSEKKEKYNYIELQL
jgi:PBP1b-binding outer membrane lipoprotein LpoB